MTKHGPAANTYNVSRRQNSKSSKVSHLENIVRGHDLSRRTISQALPRAPQRNSNENNHLRQPNLFDDNNDHSTSSNDECNDKDEQEEEEVDVNTLKNIVQNNYDKNNNTVSQPIAVQGNTQNYYEKENLEKSQKKVMYTALNSSEISSLKAHFRKNLFIKLKFVTDNVIKYKSKNMEECYRIINCESDDSKAEKQLSIIKLMEHCIMSKRNYVIARLDSKLKGTYFGLFVCLVFIQPTNFNIY
jgi:hypothetical protein